MLAPALSTLGLVALAWAGPAPHAAFLSNLAYRSPSLNVADLAIPLSSVQQRLGKRWNDVWAGNVSFPCINSVRLGHAEVHSYGVASGDPYSDSVILQTIAQPYDLEVRHQQTDTANCAGRLRQSDAISRLRALRGLQVGDRLFARQPGRGRLCSDDI